MPADMRVFCRRNLLAVGVDKPIAQDVASALTQASSRGVNSHGVRLLPHYLRAVEAGRLNPKPAVKFRKKSVSTGVLDADHTFGHAAGAQAMRHAVSMASECGCAVVTVKNSSHFGAAAFFALIAAQKNMIGLSFTHADSLLLSAGSKRAYFGTNPIAFAAPVEGEDPLCLDMATTKATWNKVLQMRGDKIPMPIDWAVDDQGCPVRDPSLARSLLPIGSYKGFGLSMMVEVLCSLLTGMPYGRKIVRMYSDPIAERRYLGHFFCAIKIADFVPLKQFKQRLKQMMDEVRREPAMNPDEPVMVPGDPEKKIEAQRRRWGIPLEEEELREFQHLSKTLNIPLPLRAKRPVYV